MQGTEILTPRARVRVRYLADPFALAFRECAPVDLFELQCAGKANIAELEPAAIRERREKGLSVWADIDGLRLPFRAWGEIPPSARTITFGFSPAGTETLIFIGISLILTAAQVLIARQNKPGKQPSPTYTFGPIQTQALGGLPIPVVYGKHKVGGNIISQKVTVNSQGKAALSTLIAVSEGPIASFAGVVEDKDGLTGNDIPAGIQVNGVEASLIPGVEVSWRLGTVDQTAIPGFDDLSAGFPVGTVVNQNFPVTYRTNDEVEALDVLLTFTGGLYYQGKKLHSKAVPITIKLQKLAAEGAAIDPNGWTTVDNFTVKKKILTAFTVQRSYGPLEKGFWAIEVTRNWVDDDAFPGHVSEFTLDSVNEILLDDSISYVNTAVVAVKALATENINGQPNFTFVVDGVLCYVWTTGTVEAPVFTNLYTKNPAWIVLNALTNVRYGAGEVHDLSHVDLQSFKNWADFCDELIDVGDGLGTLGKRFEVNIVFDTQEPIWEQCQKVAAAARASLVKTGKVVKVFVDKAASPVQIFSAGNIIQDTFRVNYSSSKEAANVIEAEFLNRLNDYARDTAVVQDADISQLYSKDNVFLFGITDAYMAYRQAKYLLNVAKLLRRSVEFESPIESIACEVGDVVAIQHDVPAWGLTGGRVLEATATTVKLDRATAILPGTTPRISVRTHAPAMAWSACTFAWSSAFATSRAWIGASGVEAIQTRAITPPAAMSTWAASTFAWNSATAQNNYWAQTPAGAALTVAAAWDAGDIPQKGDLYVYDKSSSDTPVGRRYRVLEIRRRQRFRAALKLMEYNAAVYDDATGNLDQKFGSDPPNPAALPPDVTGLAAVEIVTVETDGTALSTIQVSWAKPNHSLPYNNRVYIRPENIPQVSPAYELVGEATGSSFTIPPEFFEVGFTYRVAVTSVSIEGTEKAPESAPSTLVTPTGTAPKPPDVTGFSGIQSGANVLLNWIAVSAADLSGYEIRYGASWDSGLTIGTDLQGTSFQTTNWVPGSNTYWIKAKNTTGAYSVNAASALVVCVAQGTVALDEEEAPDFVGTKGNYDQAFPELLSNTAGQSWSASTFAWNSAQAGSTAWAGLLATYETPIYRPGSWASLGPQTWTDLGAAAWQDGASGSYSIQAILDAVAIDTLLAWSGAAFSWSDAKAVASDWRGALVSDSPPVSHALKISTSADGTSFNPFTAFTPGNYTLKAMKLKLESQGASAQYKARVRGLRTLATTA